LRPTRDVSMIQTRGLAEKGRPMNTSPFEASLLVALTNSQTPPRNFSLTLECAVIVLTRTVRALNARQVRNFEELAERREIAALLIGLRLDIQREAVRHD
jgi:hypothetical protein